MDSNLVLVLLPPTNYMCYLLYNSIISHVKRVHKSQLGLRGLK